MLLDVRDFIITYASPGFLMCVFLNYFNHVIHMSGMAVMLDGVNVTIN